MFKAKRFSTLDKLTLLLAVFALGFAFVLLIGYNNTVKMRKGIDLIYFGSYVQVVKLKNIKETIDDNLLKEIIRYNNKSVPSLESIENIRRYQELINKEWQYYKNSYKTEEEQKNVVRLDRLIAKSSDFFDDIALYMSSERTINLDEVMYRLKETQTAIKATVRYETDNAYLQKKAINDGYIATLRIMAVLVVVIIIAIAVISYYIVKNIQRSEDALLKMARELKEMSITDPMTKLYNRRHFKDVFTLESRKCHRDKSYLSFMMIDIDFFKKYNDTYGHGMGDDVLKSVAACFKENLRRPGDFVFRLGGEEFGVLISGEEPSKTKILANLLVQKVRDLKISHKASDASEFVTISLGFITFVPDGDTDMEKIMETADEHLYETKENGRNGVTGVEL